jgi:hypothetical protein
VAATEAGVASSPEIAAHVTNAQETPLPFRPWPWWHLLGLWSLVVAQPLFEVLRQNGDFFVAHRASPFDLGLFVVVLSLVLPAILGLAIRSLGVVSVLLARAAHLLAVAGLLAAMASQVVQRVTDLPTWPHVFVSVALGGLVAWGYAQSAALRWCSSLLVGTVPVFAAMFLLHPKMEAFVRPLDRTTRLAASVPQGAPPIVMVVFDQLPLSSLLAPDGSIDERHYPGFAALAGDATWFRNATANGEYTGWALPAIMTGVLPKPARLPIAQHHPQNLFTVIGDAYRFEVTEPITRLCPERLCPADDGPAAERLVSMLLDTSVVYAHIVAPTDLRGLLPALTDDWRDFVNADQWQGRWVRARDRDRTEPVTRFIESISAGDRQPTMYFLHVLLPHEPYVYLRSGQRFSSEPRIAGMSGERWGTDEYLVSLGYQRHLTQLEFVDGVVARLVAKLRKEGLYDKAVLVVTSDHGASFRPGKPWKGLDESNRPDIMGVPLFIKAPGQAGGRVDARNMQAIDVLPTIASLLRVSLRDTVDGVSAVGEPRADTRKTIRHGSANRETVVETAEHERSLMESVARRWSTMADGTRAVPPGARREWLDATAPPGGPLSPLTVLLEGPQRFSNVDLKAPSLPLYVSGRAFDAEGRPATAQLAIAVNGTVRALARTVARGPGSQEGAWTTLLPASALRTGRNVVQVFALGEGGRDLELAYSSGQRPESLNLSSNAAAQFWGVTLAGLYSRERKLVSARWTTGEASLSVPLDVEPRPRSLRIGLTGPPPAGGPVRVRVNDCVLHDGVVDSSPWYRTFPLEACGALQSAVEADIVIQSATVKGEDGRPRGVGVETINLFAAPWPPPPPAPGELEGTVSVVGTATGVARTEPVVAQVGNTGAAVWGEAGAQGTPERSCVAVELRWRRLPAGPVDRTQQLRLPRVLYPGDVVRFDVPLVPPPSVDGDGPWEVALVPVAVAGGEVAVQATPTVHVTASAAR